MDFEQLLALAKRIDKELGGTSSAVVLQAMQDNRPLNTHEFSPEDVLIAYTLWNSDDRAEDEAFDAETYLMNVWNQAQDYSQRVADAVTHLQHLTAEELEAEDA